MKQENPGRQTAIERHKRPKDLTITYDPLPNSEKVYVSGTLYPDIRVPFRKISLSPTHHDGQDLPNSPLADL